jgi:hypothetical protein
MKQTVTVIYPTGSFASRGEKPYLTEPERHKLVIDAPAGTPTSQKLELVWRMMNRVDNSPIEAQHAAMQIRSMCAGDQVEMDGLTFICEGMGFKYIMPSLGYVNVPPEGVVKARA